jgi:hypothetical protein
MAVCVAAGVHQSLSCIDPTNAAVIDRSHRNIVEESSTSQLNGNDYERLQELELECDGIAEVLTSTAVTCFTRR